MLRNTAKRFKSDFIIKVSKSGLNIVRYVTSVNLTDVTKTRHRKWPPICNTARQFTTSEVNSKSSDTSHDRDWGNALQYDHIPGPKGIQGLLAFFSGRYDNQYNLIYLIMLSDICHSVLKISNFNPTTAHKDSSWNKGLPYNKIPGPGILAIGKFFPGGEYHNLPLENVFSKYRAEYGDIVKLKGYLRQNETILIFDPNDFELVFRTEGIWPVRPGMETLRYFRKNYNQKFFEETGGLVAEHGEKWASFRSTVNPVMLQPKTVKQYIPGIDEISTELMTKIRNVRDQNNQINKEFHLDVNAWALESIAFIALDKRFNLLSDLDRNSDGYKLLQGVRNFLDQAYKLEALPSLWRYFKTPLFNKQMKTLVNIIDILIKYIDAAIENLKKKDNSSSVNQGEESVLQKLLKIDRSVAMIMATDLLSAGADTTGSLTIGFIYALAKNPDKQEKLRQEILKILPNKDSKLTTQSMSNIPYLRACFKETIRTQSIMVGNARLTGQDLVIKGYQIPKGTQMVLYISHLYMDETVFPQAKKYLPERWLVNNVEGSECPSAKTAHPFAFLPFGYGPRTCIGKRFSELEMECLIAKLVRNFKIEWNGKHELQYRSDFINIPTGDMPFQFIDLDY